MGKLKSQIYNFLVRKNENVQYEYERYVMENIQEHYESHAKHWKILWKLNWHYRIRKNSTPLIFWDRLNETRTSAIKNDNLVQKNGKKNKKRDNLLAYVDGTESEAFKRTYVHHIVKRYLKYDVVSFDAFDTLILRPFAKPTDLFFLLEDLLEQRDFHKIRIECESKARERAMVIRGNREVTIEDIYYEIERVTGIKKEEGVRTEFELEKKLCFANPYMKRVLDILKSYGKEIYVISDMYYPKKMMVELMEACGLNDFKDVIVSCDYNCNKNEQGMLYKIFVKQLRGKSVIHVGDNWRADIVMAKKYGLQTHYYKGVNAVGEQYRADGMSELIGSGYAGIVNARLHCGLKRYPIYYEYGYVYGGIYVLGFCNYILNYARANQIDKILFLARDGDVYSKVFKKINSDINYEYAYWSRMANAVSTISQDRYSFINRLLDGKVANNISITISALLKSSGLESLLVYLKNYRVNQNEFLSKNNALILQNMLLDHYDEIAEIYAKKESKLRDYYRKVVGDAKRIAIVDVGWTGSNVEGLSKKLTKDWKICDYAIGILAASNGWNKNITTAYDQNATIQPYLFSRSYNRAEFDSFVLSNNHLGTTLFEIFTQSPTPSFKEIGENDEIKFDVPEVENYQMIKEIHKGILDFAKEYMQLFGEYPIMMNISGYDAYMPFRKVFRDLAYFKKYFSNMAFSVSMFSDKETQSMETIGNIMSNKRI